jgi:hypothetical protein
LVLTKETSCAARAVPHRPAWDYGIVFAHGRDFGVELRGERSFTTCITLATGLF